MALFNDRLKSQLKDIAADAKVLANNKKEQMVDMGRDALVKAGDAAEDARLSSTGIEFGGYNPDPNLNPSMHSQQDSMTNMNSFNNGSGMF